MRADNGQVAGTSGSFNCTAYFLVGLCETVLLEPFQISTNAFSVTELISSEGSSQPPRR